MDPIHLVAGVTAGAISTVALFPLDLLKTRLQVQDGRKVKTDALWRASWYTGPLDAVRVIRRTEGLRAFYAGLTPALLGAASSWGLYFFLYENAKTRKHWAADETTEHVSKLGAAEHLAAACEAGVVTAVATNPIWLIKTRLQLQQRAAQQTLEGALGTAAPHKYRGMADAAASIVREEGPLALYRGLIPALLLVSHGAIQFTVYEEMKKFAQLTRAEQTPLHTTLMASFSKLIASTATYPYQLVKSRLQARGADLRYKGFLDCVLVTYRFEGIRGFFKGLSPNLLRVVPSSAITFVAYEQIMKGLGR